MKGIKYLMTVCHNNRIKYKKYPWLADLSKLLSESGNCYNFWYEVDRQGKICKIPYCKTVYDILYDVDHYILSWSGTPQGHNYWSNVFSQLFYPNESDNSVSITQRLRLSEINKIGSTIIF